jgi:hypothetical protein
MYSVPSAIYRYNRNRNNVVSTEISHIIWLSTAEEIDSLYMSAMSFCACEAEKNLPRICEHKTKYVVNSLEEII